MKPTYCIVVGALRAPLVLLHLFQTEFTRILSCDFIGYAGCLLYQPHKHAYFSVHQKTCGKKKMLEEPAETLWWEASTSAAEKKRCHFFSFTDRRNTQRDAPVCQNSASYQCLAFLSSQLHDEVG